MAYNFSNAPYYDDYSDSKKFHRVLFKPGFAVQARELTQLQTILQKQIERFGNHVFKEGTRVSGCARTLNLRLDYVKLKNTNSGGTTITAANLASLVGKEVQGLTSGVKAYVIDYADGLEATAPDYKTLFIKYTDGGNDAKVFLEGETLQEVGGALTVRAIDANAVGRGSRITIDDGIVFAQGNFIFHTKQSIILDKYSNVPSKKVGFKVIEDIIDSSEDASLLENAQGTLNYAAPGADRYKLTTQLVVKDIDETDLTDFYQLYEISEGFERSVPITTEYNVLLDQFATRTFEESGNYTVQAFPIRIREHLNTGTNNGWKELDADPTKTGDKTKLAIGIEKGTAYIQGYRRDNLSTKYLPVDKGITFDYTEQQPVAAAFGNYVLVKEVAGVWNVDAGVTVSIRSAASQALTNLSYSEAAAAGTQIGTAKVKSLVHDSGTPGTATAVYRLYLTDIQMSTGSFQQARSVYFTDSSTANGVADIVLETSGIAQIKESAFDTAIFKFPQRAIKRLRATDGSLDNAYTFKKVFDITVAADGTASISSSINNEVFPFNAGALNDTQKLENVVLITKATATTTNLTGTVSLVSGNATVTGSGTAFLTQLAIGDVIKVGSDEFRVATVISNNSLTVSPTPSSTVSGQSFAKFYNKGSYINLTGKGVNGSNRSVSLTSSTLLSFNLQENYTGTFSAQVVCDVQRTDGQEAKKTLMANKQVQIDTATHPNTNGGTYTLGFSDIYKVKAIHIGTSYSTSNPNYLSSFNVDNGQRDTHYTHGRISKKAGVTLDLTGKKILVVLDYFKHDHSAGTGYFSVDSYPVDDNVDSDTDTFIRTENIPVYFSKTGIYDLRDCVDFRYRYIDTASDSSATTNPAAPTSIFIPTGGLRVPSPNETFLTDLEYYLSRRDRIVLDKDGVFTVVQGVPALNPVIPEEPANAMTLATLFVPPYPSLATESARQTGRKDYEAVIKVQDNKRYTMKDIGALEQRINRLEYYTSLSLLEKEAASMVIPSPDTGMDRFKNGILVDAFTGHNVGNIYDKNYACAIDPTVRELRPSFLIENIDLEVGELGNGTMRAPKDAVITLTSTPATSFERGEQIATSGGATGKVIYQVGPRLYLEQVTGTFVAAQTLTGNGSGATGTISTVVLPPAGDLITLNFVHQEYAKNPFASKPRNCVSDLLFTWSGEMELDPPADNWTDTTKQPDLAVNFDGNYDNWAALQNAWGTQWNDWETVVTGVSTDTKSLEVVNGTRVDSQRQNWQTQNGFIITQGTTTTNTTVQDVSTLSATTTTTTQRQTRSGVTLSVTPETITKNMGTRVVDTSIIPYMRSKLITFSASRLKPNTKLYAFFDGEKVSDYCRPAGGAYGDDLVTDATGKITGQFLIPNSEALRFRTGSKVFRLCDDVENRDNWVTTAVNETYTASGLTQTQQDTIVSTREARVSFNTVLDEPKTVTDTSVGITTSRTERVTGVAVSDRVTRVIDTTPPPPWDGGGDGGGGGDPLAQSFFVTGMPHGTFMSKIDVFFRTKHATLPITLQLREMINGVPSTKILPFGSVEMLPANINISEDASAPTTFQFKSPVYLQNDTEYCFVLLPAGNNPDYNIWVSELGENSLGTTNRISEQPFTGVLFTSSNNRTWNSVQSEDVKFTLYRADFDTTITGTATLDNRNVDYLKIGSLVGAAFEVGEVITSATGNATIQFYDRTNEVLGVLNNTTTSKFIVGQQITFGSGAGYKAATITEIQDKKVTLFKTDIQTLEFNPTFMSWEYNITDNAGNPQATNLSFVKNENTSLDGLYKVMSRTAEVNSLNGNPSFEVVCNMSTASSTVSPVIDTKKMTTIIVNNEINNDATNETTNAGNAKARYASRKVILNDDQDAEDLNVYLGAYRPAGTDVKVYAKLQNAQDAQVFEEMGWVEMTQTSGVNVFSDGLNTSDYKEYEYHLPESVLTGPNGSYQYLIPGTSSNFTGFKVFAIKIVMLSNNPAVVPKVKDMRAIALQK